MKLSTALLAAAICTSAQAQDVAVFPAKVSQVYRVRLEKDAGLLESITSIIQKHGIKDGAVLTAVGALATCTYHGVGGGKQTVAEPMEINSLGGIIANGEPHIHVMLTNAKRGAFGGHLENGCKVGNRVELTLAQFSGDALERKQGALEKKDSK